MKIYLFALLVFLLLSCFYMRSPDTIFKSPSGLYILKIGFNNIEADKTKYQCLILTLFDNQNKQITTLQTGASNYQKWAVDWYPKKDTIIVNSGDIGTSAYRITDKKQLDTIALTKDIDSIAEIIFQKKYSNR